MPVYVDPIMNHGWRLGPSCHMFADTDEELHEMAQRIGLKRSWHQPPKGRSFSHYDLTVSRRIRAIVYGCIILDRRQASDKWKELGYR